MKPGDIYLPREIASHVYLFMDVKCTKCGRMMAFSNAFQYKNQYLCPRCSPSMEELIEELEAKE